MNKMVAINQIGEMIVIHTDDPSDQVISDRLQMILMADVDPVSIVVFDDKDYTVYKNHPNKKVKKAEPGLSWTAPMSFLI